MSSTSSLRRSRGPALETRKVKLETGIPWNDDEERASFALTLKPGFRAESGLVDPHVARRDDAGDLFAIRNQQRPRACVGSEDFEQRTVGRDADALASFLVVRSEMLRELIAGRASGGGEGLC